MLSKETPHPKALQSAMSSKLIPAALVVALAGGTAAYFFRRPPSPGPVITTTTRARYTCTTAANGTWITQVENGAKPIVLFNWVSEYFSESTWTPEARCKEVSPKFQMASDNGMLNYLTNAEAENGLPILCANSSTETTCDFMLFTLKPDDKPDAVRQMLIDMAEGSRMDPIPQSGSYKVYVPFQQILENSPDF